MPQKDPYFFKVRIIKLGRAQIDQIVIRLMPFKDSFKINRLRSDDIDDSNNIIKAIPIMNLDIHVLIDKKKYPIEDYDVEVAVAISIDCLHQFKSLEDVNDLNLFMFPPGDKGKWEKIENKKSKKTGKDEIKETKAIDGKYALEFIVCEWPKDDRMIGCG